MKLKLPNVAHKQEFVPFSGGLDVVTPPLMVSPCCE